ncbi:hypothetical protein RIF29_16070 [Crotalaria pallida]|uniref:Uncharacterized protein n=1 Tax=Crotalaria pallida TaxID=3830 RepID=A0AAN9FER2_CROPI
MGLDGRCGAAGEVLRCCGAAVLLLCLGCCCGAAASRVGLGKLYKTKVRVHMVEASGLICKVTIDLVTRP